jgi:hypothetical protein
MDAFDFVISKYQPISGRDRNIQQPTFNAEHSRKEGKTGLDYS